ncbi:MAG TPA: PEP/pyruvate-binding domain-containing protein, partial [Anaerolineaceae bacterium]
MPALHVDQALADQLVDQAIQSCAAQKFHGDLQQARQALRLGRCDTCAAVSDCLVRQVGEYLGQVDRTVKAVFQCEPEFAGMRLKSNTPGEDGQPSGIHLAAWVERKSAALEALCVALENALAASRQRIPCQDLRPSCFVLDIQQIDDRDVRENRGYGLLVNHRFVRSAQVWQREECLPAGGAAVQPGGASGAAPLQISFDTEFSPESVLFSQAEEIEKLPAEERRPYEPHLREIKVALIRRLISDQLAYINIAKEWFTFADLADIFRRKIGNGRIGGKAAGMVLAGRIVQETLDEQARACIQVPESFYVGSDVLYLFMSMNGLMHWNNQKYKPEEEIRGEYPQIREEFQQGKFPPEVACELGSMLEQIGPRPVIVRSSSLLEDNFGTSFAGKYESIFLPNQAGPGENLEALTRAIARIYSSTLKPDTLLYRRSKGLQDYDERMAVLIQAVQGEQYGRYYFPLGAGVAFSRNLYRWSPHIRKEDGFIRLVWGLGTRAVERVGNDYPRLVALSHPNLHPDDDTQAIRYYSQHNIDLIDLEENRPRSLPIQEVLGADYPGLRQLAQIEEDGYFTTPRGRVLNADIPRLAVTFDELIRRTAFAGIMTRMLRVLEEHYQVPVDMEFTLHLDSADQMKPQVRISLLQCRPQSVLQDRRSAALPRNLEPEKIIFTSSFMVPQGYLPGIRRVLFVTPEGYYQLPTQAERNEIRKLIAALNAALEEKSFICVGPGRWGTVNPDLGVFVSYSDIDHSAALVELSGKGVGPAPEPSLGTHFFQDLMEADIY